jgi:hypothetical protein
MIRRLSLVLLLSLLLSSPAWAATPTFDAVSENGSGAGVTNATSSTHSHTAGTLTNGIAMVCVTTQDASVDHDGVTYGGNVATQIGSTIANNNVANSLWYYLAPPAGASDVVANFGGDNMNTILVSVVTYANVNQSSPINTACGSGSGLCSANNFDTTDPAEAQVTVTSAVGELVVGCGSIGSGSADPTTSNTLRSAMFIASNHRHGQVEAAGAATVDVDLSGAGNNFNTMLGISLKPSSRRPIAPIFLD